MNKQINKFPWKRFRKGRTIDREGGGGEVSVIKLTSERPSGFSNDSPTGIMFEGQRRK